MRRSQMRKIVPRKRRRQVKQVARTAEKVKQVSRTKDQMRNAELGMRKE